MQMKKLLEYPRICVAFEPGSDVPSKQNGGIPCLLKGETS
jgi:hypothetical protein